jgi:hypothetical protein
MTTNPATYKVFLDTERDGTFGAAVDDISDYVESVTWGVGQSDTYGEYAQAQRASFILRDPANQFSQDRTGATYYGKLRPSTLLKVVMTLGATTQQMWIGKLANMQTVVGAAPDPQQQRVELAAVDPTYQLDDIEFIPALMISKRIDEGIAAALESGQWLFPYNSSGWLLGYSRLGINTILAVPSAYYELETSYVTLAYIGDHLQRDALSSIGGYVENLVGAEGGGRFFWDGRTSKFRFHNRYHDALTVSAATITDGDVVAMAVRRGDDIVNEVRVRYTQRSTGTAASVLASNSTSFVIRAEKDRKIRLSYKDPNSEAARCAGLNVISPVDGVDVVYSGGALTITSTVGATSTEVTLTNGGSTDVTVTLVQVRGTPLLQYDTSEVVKSDAASVGEYDKRSRTFNTSIQDPDEADRYARKLIQRFVPARTRVESISFLVTDGAQANWAQTLKTGDTITFEDAGSTLRGAYVIVGERHRVGEGGSTHEVTYLLKSKVSEQVWVLGSPTLSILGVSTILG